MRSPTIWALAIVALSWAGIARGAQIGLNAFDGNEQVINFTPGFTSVAGFVSSPVTYQGVTFSSFVAHRRRKHGFGYRQ